MKVSYSSYRTYIDCPRLYKYRSEKKEPPAEQSKYFALYGLLIESFFKDYTNNYSKQGTNLKDQQIRAILDKNWNKILKYNYVDWNEPWVKKTPSQIFQETYDDVLSNLKTFDFWKRSRSEVTINIFLKKSSDTITSRLDFIWNQLNGNDCILDGKGTEKIETNVDNEQLYFYTLIYLLKYGKLPDKIGFLFYRYQIIRYLDFDLDTIMSFKNKLSLVKKAMKEDKIFKPNVKLSKHCRWCEYRFVCDAYSQKKEANAKKRKKVINIETEGSVIDFGPGGMV